MPERWTIAERTAREKAIAKAIRSAASELPKSPSAASWERYREALRSNMRDAMIESAEAAARSAGRVAGIEGMLSDSTLRQIEVLAREQAKLITSNSMRAVNEATRNLRRLGLNRSEMNSMLNLVTGLDRRQAGALVNSLRSGLSQGKRFQGAMRGLVGKSEKYLDARASRIGAAQGRRAANLGVSSIMQGLEGSTKKWHALPTACEVCANLDGTEIPVTEPFEHPVTGDEVFGGDVHSSCKCFTEYFLTGAGELLGESELEDVFGAA